MALYSGSTQGVTPGNNVIVWDIVKAASPGISRITEIYNFGESGASTVNRLVVGRNATAGATPTAGSVQKLQGSETAAAFAFNTAYTTAPTFVAGLLLAIGFNGFGGLFKWTAYKDDEGIYQVAGKTNVTEGVSMRSPVAGAGVISGHVIWEEM